MIIVFLLIVIIIILIIFLVLIKKLPSPSIPQLIKQEIKQKLQENKSITQESGPIVQDETLYSRDCFKISIDAQNVLKILKSLNLENKYNVLLNAYSLALCLLIDFQVNSCVNTESLEKRIDILNTWNANPKNDEAIAIVDAIIQIKNQRVNLFLIMICDICENQINIIKNDVNISKYDKEQISGYNSEFYRDTFDKINSYCK